MKRIKKGDQVIVIAGKDKGRQGTVLRVADDSILIEAVNLVKKHTKANPMAGVEGGIIEKEMPMDISNVMLEDGRKVRYFKSNGEVVDV
jgi:large subunit ribosomal protein L24